MFVPKSLRRLIPIAFGMVAALSIPASAGTRLQLASVPPEYTPTAGPGLPEPVSLQSFSFEVEKETRRAKVVVEYTYPDQPAFGLDGGVGPEPTMAQIPGLSYDAESRAIVYEDAGKRLVCATVSDHRFLFWRTLSVTPTGACMVSAQLNTHAEDNGWSIHRYQAIDTFFETR